MRLVEALQLAAVGLGAVVSAYMAIEQRLISRLRRAGAATPETAMEAPRLGALLRRRLATLEVAGAVIAVGPDRLYLDEEVYSSLRKKRAVRGALLAVLALALVVVVHTALQR